MEYSSLFWEPITVCCFCAPNRLIKLISLAAVDTRDASSTAMLSGAGMNPMGPQEDMVKPFKAEVENLALAEGLYRWAGEGVEDRVLAKWGKGTAK